MHIISKYFRAPFDVSLTILIIMCVIVVLTWSENYGSKTNNIQTSMAHAVTSIKEGKSLLAYAHSQNPRKQNLFDT